MNRAAASCKCCLVAVLACCLTTGRAAGQDPWYNAAWPYRRAVTIPPRPPTRLSGDDVAFVTMPTGGLIKGDGGDIRLTTQQGAEVPHRVLMIGPGDSVTVAFGLRAGCTKYYVYFGNAAAKMPPALEIRRGVLLEVYRHAGRPPLTLEEMQGRVKDDSGLVGRGFRDDIFQGYNPFGPETRILAVYTGFLVCPWSGSYTFCSSSQDASFLLIDGRLIVDNSGRHGPQRDIRKQGTVELQSGLHKLTFIQACEGGDPVAVAAWRPPGQSQTKPIPSSAFAEVAQAAPQAMEEHFKAITADFIPDHAGEAFMDNFYMQRYSFDALTSAWANQQAQFAWDFGDGQTAARKSADHVYLVDGEYVVTLKVKAASGEYVRSNRLAVRRPWDRVSDTRMDSLQQYAGIVADYDFSTAGDEAISKACQLFHRTGRGDQIVRAAQAMLRRDKPAPEPLSAVLPMYAEVLAEAGQSVQAGEAMLKGARMTDIRALRAWWMLEGGRRFLESGAGDERAMSVFQEIVSTFTGRDEAPIVRLARIGIGDVWRIRGDYDKAAAAYDDAGPPPGQSTTEAAMLQGDMARHVEAYLREEDYGAAEDYLQRWANAIPADKLGGYWSLLKVQLCLGQSRPEEGVAEAEVLLAANPASPYAPRLLMLTADACERMHQADRAAAALRRLVEQYPESELVSQAEVRLKAR